MLEEVSENEIRLIVHVKTNAPKTAIKLYDDALEMRITSSPTRGKANKEIINLLSEILEISSNNIFITRGVKSTKKMISIYGISLERILRKLTKFQQAQMKQ